MDESVEAISAAWHWNEKAKRKFYIVYFDDGTSMVIRGEGGSASDNPLTDQEICIGALCRKLIPHGE